MMPNGLDRPEAPRHGKAPVVWLVLLVAIVLSPPVLIAMAFWAASAPWEFSGSGIRHWIFVKGSTVDRLGFVSATVGPPRYVMRIQEGTDPGSVQVTYGSDALPAHVAAAYASRCLALGLSIKKQAVSEDAVKASVVCERRPEGKLSDDVWVQAERPRDATTTDVSVTAGPGLTLVYNFD